MRPVSGLHVMADECILLKKSMSVGSWKMWAKMYRWGEYLCNALYILTGYLKYM